MKKKTKYQGLCLTCKNDLNCNLPRVSSIPIEQCDKYISVGEGETEKKSREKIPRIAYDTAREMGLCINCENREICSFPDAGKDVKYCEEYQ